MTSLASCVLLAHALVAVDPSPSSTTEPKERALRVAVYALENTGVDARVARLVDRFLLVELRKLSGVSVLGMEEIQQMLDHEAQKQVMGCSEDESCLADIAGSLGVDELVTGSVARVGDEHVIGLRRIDQKNAGVLGNVSKRLVATNGEELLAALGPVVEELYADRPLKKGVSRGVPKEVAASLDPPPLDPWVSTSLFVGAGVVAAFTVVAVSAYAVATFAHTAMLADAETAPQLWSTVSTARTAANAFAISTWVLVATGVALGGTGGVLALFTDWRGTRDAFADDE